MGSQFGFRPESVWSPNHLLLTLSLHRRQESGADLNGSASPPLLGGSPSEELSHLA